MSLVTAWLVLLRVHEGGVTWMDGHYLNHGRPVAGYLAEVIEELIRAGLLVPARPDPIGAQRVCVTHAGQIRYAELNSNGALPEGGPVAVANELLSPPRITELPASVYYDNDFRFLLDLTMPRLSHGHPNGDLNDLILCAPDGSRAHITPDGALTQAGPRRLWDDIEAIHQTWCSLGGPARERFGLTVTPQRQTIWLDTPDSDHNWQAGFDN